MEPSAINWDGVIDDGDNLAQFATPVDPHFNASLAQMQSNLPTDAVTATGPRQLFDDPPTERLPRREAIISSLRAQKMSRNFASPEAQFHDGFDSDGEIGPHFDAIDGEEESEEAEVGVVPKGTIPGANPPVAAVANPIPIHISTDSIKQMKVKKLRDELKRRNRTQNGAKPDLVSRLIAAIAEGAPVVYPAATDQQQKTPLTAS